MSGEAVEAEFLDKVAVKFSADPDRNEAVKASLRRSRTMLGRIDWQQADSRMVEAVLEVLIEIAVNQPNGSEFWKRVTKKLEEQP